MTPINPIEHRWAG